MASSFALADDERSHSILAIDKVVNRKEIKGEIGKLLSILLKKNSELNSEVVNETSKNIESLT